MPELPEVETVRRQLLSAYRNDRIESVRVNNPSLFQNCSGSGFISGLQGRRLIDVSRKGKYLIFSCEDSYPVFHLGMSGIFLQDAGRSKFPQHIHVEIGMRSGKHLYFQDVRRFGKIWLYDRFPALEHLGVDPVSDGLDYLSFRKMLCRSASNLKLFLMDQSHLAGVGNIYASEMLFEAMISPLRKTNSLSGRESLALYSALKNILYRAIDNFGTTYSAYQTVEGESGQNQNFLRVYQCAGRACLRCGATIQKTTLGSRSTFYCPVCQN